VAGCTLLAYGNGAPDIFTAHAAIHGANDFALVGSSRSSRNSCSSSGSSNSGGGGGGGGRVIVVIKATALYELGIADFFFFYFIFLIFFFFDFLRIRDAW